MQLPLTHGADAHSSILVAHVVPVNPFRQLHRNPATMSCRHAYNMKHS